MKCLPLLILLLFSLAEAQTSSESSGLSVIQNKWRISSVNSRSTEEDPYQAINETKQTIEDQKDFIRQNAVRQKMGLPQEPLRVRTDAPEAASRSAFSKNYIYQIKVKNIGKKTIQIVEWEYVFFDPNTSQELGRHKFVSKINIKPGKVENLAAKSFSAPSPVINAKDAEKNSPNLYREQINIKRIQYSDGFVWRPDSK